MAAPALGLHGQMMYAAESPYGTAVAVTRGGEFEDESFKQTIQRMETTGVRTGVRFTRSDRWQAGRKDVQGSYSTEVLNKGFGLLLKHIFGAVVIAQPDAGGNPTVYDHTLTPGPLDALSLTKEFGFKDTAGNAFKKTIEGAQCKGFELGAAVGEYVMLKPEWVAEDMAVTTGVTTASYPASTTPLTFVGASVTVAGSAFPLEAISIKGTHVLDEERYFLGSALRSQCPEIGKRDYAVTLSPEFVDWTAYNRFVNGTEAAVVATFAGAQISGIYNYGLTITMNVRTDGDTPEIKGTERVKQPLMAKCIGTSDTASTAFSAVYRTTDSAS